MKKTTKTLLTLVVILVILVLGYVAVNALYDGNTETETESDTEDVTGTVAETAYVVDLDGILALKYSDGTTEMSFIQGDLDWYYETDDMIALDQNSIADIISTFRQIEAVRTIEEPDALADYGLEAANYTVEITDTEGNVVTLYIGNAVDDCYYAAIGDKDVVYTISSSVVTTMEFDIENLKAEEETEETTESSEGDTIEGSTAEGTTEDVSNGDVSTEE